MAATFWRAIIGFQLSIAASVAFVWWMTHASVLPAVLVGLAALAALQLIVLAVMYLAVHSDSRRARPLDGVTHAVRAVCTEAVHFGRAQLAMSAEPWRRRPEESAHGPAQRARPVLLLHGILCNRAIWRPLAARLRAAGFAPVSAINLEPPGADIDACAASAERELLSLYRDSGGTPVAIVGHSMGGLVARSLLRSVGPELIRTIVTVASPHHGSKAARLLSLPGARQMRPGSLWLRALNAAQEGRLPVPVTCIFGRDDGLIAPARSAALEGARWLEVRGVGHFGLLRSRAVHASILEALGRG